jgi:hypothetical protein
MSRLLMAAFGGLLGGIALWFVVGFAAAQIAMRSGGGGPDGGGAMSGFFFIGGIGGLAGAGLGAWTVWRLLADPSRTGTVSGALLGLLAVLVAGLVYTLTPKHEVRNDFPEGKRGEFQVEARFPSSRTTPLTFQLRGGSFFMEVPWQREKLRQELDRTIVPATFRLQEVRTWILAIMDGDNQLASTTVGIDGLEGRLQESTPWSDWTPIESGIHVRWRFAVM